MTHFDTEELTPIRIKDNLQSVHIFKPGNRFSNKNKFYEYKMLTFQRPSRFSKFCRQKYDDFAYIFVSHLQ